MINTLAREGGWPEEVFPTIPCTVNGDEDYVLPKADLEALRQERKREVQRTSRKSKFI